VDWSYEFLLEIEKGCFVDSRIGAEVMNLIGGGLVVLRIGAAIEGSAEHEVVIGGFDYGL
jgi:hypothetical protein